MELNFKELTGIAGSLERIAAALEKLTGCQATVEVKETPTKEAAASSKPTEEPKAKKAEAAESEVDLKELRKFAATANKRGVKVQTIIKREGHTETTRLSDVDPQYYEAIRAAIQADLDKLEDA